MGHNGEKLREWKRKMESLQSDEDMATMDTTKNIINSSIFDQEMKSIQRGMIVCCTRSYFTSLWAQEKIETKSLTSWTQIRTAEIHPTSNSLRFYIQTPNCVILLLVKDYLV